MYAHARIFPHAHTPPALSGLKNSPELIKELGSCYDFAINEYELVCLTVLIRPIFGTPSIGIWTAMTTWSLTANGKLFPVHFPPTLPLLSIRFICSR